MQDSSKVIMGAPMVMAVSLAIVVALLFVLLAELYCSLLLRRRRTTTTTTSAAAASQQLYGQGVIAAPRSFLFTGKQSIAETEDQHCQDQVPEVQIQESNTSHPLSRAPAAGSGEHFVYISNPIFHAETPFQTPETSPSRLESGSSSGDDPMTLTPPLSPMKKLPAEACSVSLRSLLATSKNGHSSSSSTSPHTSPSW